MLITKIKTLFIKLFLSNKITKTITTPIQATIIGKEFISSKLSTINKSYSYYSAISFPTYIYFPEIFSVTVKYNDMIESIDNQNLYFSHEINDKINITLEENYNFFGKLLSKRLKI